LPQPGGVGFLIKATNNCNKADLLPCEAAGMEKSEEIANCIKFKSYVSAVTKTTAT
jgi:hypothetical protein